MKVNERMHDFINKFETIIIDLNWNKSTMCSIFRKKLNKNLFDTIHLLHSKNWSKTFATFKALTQKIESSFRKKKCIKITTMT